METTDDATLPVYHDIGQDDADELTLPLHRFDDRMIRQESIGLGQMHHEEDMRKDTHRSLAANGCSMAEKDLLTVDTFEYYIATWNSNLPTEALGGFQAEALTCDKGLNFLVVRQKIGVLQ